MSHSTRSWSRLAVLAAASAIVFAACNAAATSAPTAAPVTAAPATEAPYAAVSYPEAPASCDDKTKNASEFSQIKAVDRLTVEFDLCQADVAFLAKIAFASNAIQDSDYLAAHAADKSLLPPVALAFHRPALPRSR